MTFAFELRNDDNKYYFDIICYIIKKRIAEIDEKTSCSSEKLIKFQQELIGIKDWKSTSIIDEDIEIFIKKTKESMDSYKKNIEELFEKIYLEIARELWSNIELFSDECTSQKKRYNKQKVDKLLKEALAEIINEYCNDELNENKEPPKRMQDFDDYQNNLLDMLSVSTRRPEPEPEPEDSEPEQKSELEVLKDSDSNLESEQKESRKIDDKDLEEFMKFKEFIKFKKDNGITDFEEYLNKLIKSQIKKPKREKKEKSEEVSIFEKPIN